MIIKRSLYSDKKEFDSNGELGTSMIMNAGGTGGLIGGIGTTYLLEKGKSKRIKKKAVKAYKDAIKKENKRYQKGLDKLKELATKYNDADLKSDRARETKEALKKMKDKIIKSRKSDIKLARDKALKELGKKKLNRYLKGGITGVMVGSGLAAYPAYKYYKKKNEGKPKRKLTTLDSTALGALGGGLASNFLKEKLPENIDFKNMDKKTAEKIDKMFKGNMKKSVGLMAAGAALGYGAKKLYDKKKKSDKDNK